MRARLIIAASLGLSFIAGAMLVVRSSQRLPIVSLPNGHQVRVLHASFGTNHSYSIDADWLSRARRLVPPLWHSKMGIATNEYRSRHPSLVLFVREYEKNLPVSPSFRGPKVLFSDGSHAEGYQRTLRGQVVSLEFPIYPRARSWLNLQVLAAGQPVDFKIRNRGGGHARAWKPLPLPQTNQALRTLLVLQTNTSANRSFLNLRAHALGQGSLGWIDWSADLFDATGNWQEHRGSRIPLSPSSLLRGPHRLLARASEYIPVAMIPLPLPGGATPLEPPLRASNLGLQSMFLLAPGTYRWTNGMMPLLISALPDKPTLLSTDEGGAPYVHLATLGPALLIIYAQDPAGGNLQARLRERREPARNGKVFSTARFLSFTNHATPRQVIRLFPLRFDTDQQQLEAELIVHHPPAEFYFNRGSQAKNAD